MENLNPLGLDRKLETQTERNHVKMVWDKSLPSKFRLFVLTVKNYLALSETQVTYQKASSIVHEFIYKNRVENLTLLKAALIENIELIRYVYSTYFPEIYNRTNAFGIKNTSVFDYTYQVWRNEKITTKMVEEKKVEPIGKDPTTYEKRVSINEFEQKQFDK